MNYLIATNGLKNELNKTEIPGHAMQPRTATEHMCRTHRIEPALLRVLCAFVRSSAIYDPVLWAG